MKGPAMSSEDDSGAARVAMDSVALPVPCGEGYSRLLPGRAGQGHGVCDDRAF